MGRAVDRGPLDPGRLGELTYIHRRDTLVSVEEGSSGRSGVEMNKCFRVGDSVWVEGVAGSVVSRFHVEGRGWFYWVVCDGGQPRYVSGDLIGRMG